MAENMTIDAYKHGKVNIVDDVIGVIGSIAAAEIEGIKDLSGTFSEEMMDSKQHQTIILHTYQDVYQ